MNHKYLNVFNHLTTCCPFSQVSSPCQVLTSLLFTMQYNYSKKNECYKGTRGLERLTACIGMQSETGKLQYVQRGNLPQNISIHQYNFMWLGASFPGGLVNHSMYASTSSAHPPTPRLVLTKSLRVFSAYLKKANRTGRMKCGCLQLRMEWKSAPGMLVRPFCFQRSVGAEIKLMVYTVLRAGSI